MPKDLLVRGIDEKIYSSLGEKAKAQGTSLNSIVKDAIDSWLSHQDKEMVKHHLILYSDDNSIINALKSIDHFTAKSSWFRSFYGPPDSQITKTLEKLKWFNGTASPYEVTKNTIQFYGKMMRRIADKAKNQPVCCFDFVISDLARKTSLTQSIKTEKTYNETKMKGVMFCPYNVEDVLSSGLHDLITLFEEHDEIFILQDDRVYKLHVSLENIHKLFFN
jgi:hypothetical protein